MERGSDRSCNKKFLRATLVDSLYISPSYETDYMQVLYREYQVSEFGSAYLELETGLLVIFKQASLCNLDRQRFDLPLQYVYLGFHSLVEALRRFFDRAG